MTGVSTSDPGASARSPRVSPGRELAGLLLGGAAGAGVVLLASRQGLARVIVRPPRPLPATVTVLSAQDLRPAIAALAVAALASLAAVLATRGLLRRLTGLVAIALGAGIAAARGREGDGRRGAGCRGPVRCVAGHRVRSGNRGRLGHGGNGQRRLGRLAGRVRLARRARRVGLARADRAWARR